LDLIRTLLKELKKFGMESQETLNNYGT